MDKVKVGVNWSALACTAFENKLNELNTVKHEEKKMTDDLLPVIARLRDSRDSFERAEYREGFEQGQKWVTGDHEHVATYHELERIENWRISLDKAEWFRMFTGDARDPEPIFVQLVRPDEDNSQDSSEFWNDILDDPDGTRLPDRQWLRGFIEGALSVWSEIKGQL